MKHFTFLMVLLLIQLSSYCQNHFGVKANFGFSRVIAITEGIHSTQQFNFSPSAQGGTFYNRDLGKNSILGMELLYLQIEGKDKMKDVMTTPSGKLTGEYVNLEFKRRISYLGIPLYYGFKFKKMTFCLGFQVNFKVKDSWDSKVTYPDDNGRLMTVISKNNKMPIDNYDYGAVTALNYNLTEKIGIAMNYYYGINNILLNTAVVDWKWSVRQMTVGMRYKFL